MKKTPESVSNSAAARPSAAGLALFDVCDTLYRANTTVGFLDDFLGTRASYRRRRWLVTSRASPLFYPAAASMRFLPLEFARALLVRALAGFDRAELQRAARRYVDEQLARLVNVSVLERLEHHRREGDRVVLASSSLDLVVAEIAGRLGVEYRASRLGFAGERCTGRIDDDLTGRKQDVAAGLRTATPGLLHVYTDNRSDEALLGVADKAVIVVPPGRSDQWARKLGHDLLRL